ncbi:MAG: tRNA pseudouridine(55) synthase TruB, partial [Halothiobacillaceae bacterium]|nr:tRNA pseudouridine(55) synthase TruB [Halothiobacillaceae bacterium]
MNGPRQRRRERGREINGIVLLDKPQGLSSNHALQRVKRLFDARKAGHTGSLDPLATGLLPVCFGSATRISGLLLDADKVYEVTARLGQRTRTGDAEGELIAEREVPPLVEADIEAVLARFRGEVDQIPPMHSALKHQGQRLYELARQGVEVERAPRRIVFHRIVLLQHDAQSLSLFVHCSKGAYIRTLIEDIGEALGCGAHVTALRRTGVGAWMPSGPGAEPPMLTLERLEALREEGLEALDRVILATDCALTGYPSVVLDADSAHYIRHGHPVFVPKAPPQGDR